MSFSEQKDKKSLVLLEISAKAKKVELLEIPQFRKLLSIKGNFEEVKEKLTNYQSDSQLIDWAEVHIHQEETDLSIRNEFENLKTVIKNVELLKYNISFAEHLKEITSHFDESKSIADIEITDVFDKMLEEQQIQGKEELKLIFKELVETIED